MDLIKQKISGLNYEYKELNLKQNEINNKLCELRTKLRFFKLKQKKAEHIILSVSGK